MTRAPRTRLPLRAKAHANHPILNPLQPEPIHAKPFSLVRGIMLFHANSAFALVVAAGLHDLLQGLLHSVPVIRLCGNGQ